MSTILSPAEPETSAKSKLETLSQAHPILFFDGVCGFCNHSIDFIARRDPGGVFRFAPLQGETAKILLENSDREDLNSMVLLVHPYHYRKSSAVVRVLWNLAWYWQVLGTLLWLIPRPIRNLGYSFVAKIRYRLFGKKSTCRMPTPEERSRFLD